ncbi:pre-piRNA 3'-exonuclease trimmer [Diaphorina citri]|uniref:Pre-piRNA 3'-exonuclease trimmer n=1 Tax=Diaphorina citri TaxID=121845 RepID=A0A3Q0J8T0_DIACI|nr:pre-piRNA 3'-exonuclease trimmer [Diaphorina citri]
MCDINRHNFLEKFDDIKKSIEEAKFIAVDCEFSGLVENPIFKNSLFDSAEERYKKLKEATQGFVIIQIGITTFKYIPQANNYESNVYNFQLCPKWYGSDDTILFQRSCLIFLCAHKFDFNEFIYNGISYLNKSDQARVKQDLDSDTWFNNIEHPFLNDDELQIQTICSHINWWLLTCSPGDSTTVSLMWVEDSYVMNYVLLYEITHRFLRKGVCAFLRSNEIHVEKFNTGDASLKQSRETLQHELLQVAKSQAWQSMLGFSQVFQLLVEHKKPLIGHNLLTDLLFMYKQFHQPLPSSLKRFKTEISRLFPCVYDTKFISYEIKSKLEKNQKWSNNGLSGLYEWLRDHSNITHLLLYAPKLKLMDGVSKLAYDKRVAEMFADFGSVDVRYHTSNSALVAAGNHVCARLSLDKLRNHPLYTISTYRPHKQLILDTIYTLGVLSSLIGGVALGYLVLSKPKL